MHPLKTYCLKNNKKIKEIAEKAKTKPVYVSQIIMGYRKPSPELASLIERATGGLVSRLELLYPDKMPNKKFLTEEEAIKYIGVTERKFADLRRDGGLPYIPLDYRTRKYAVESLEAWLLKRQKAETEPDKSVT